MEELLGGGWGGGANELKLCKSCVGKTMRHTSCIACHVECKYGLFQVEVITRKLACGGAVAIHRYMAAGSCVGVEVWQGPGLLGSALEQQLTSLVSAVVHIIRLSAYLAGYMLAPGLYMSY